jgi:hypothetical protein
MASDQDDDGWMNSPGRKAWLARRAARQERREIAAALANGPDPALGYDAIALAVRDPAIDDQYLRSICIMASILYRPSLSGPKIPLDRELAARRWIEACPKEPIVFSDWDAPAPAADRLDMATLARGVLAYQDFLGLNAEHARADAVAAGVADGSIVPIDAKATAKFILQSRDRALGKEPKS